MKLWKLGKPHCSPPLAGEDNSMVFTSHSGPFPATRDMTFGNLWLERGPRGRQKPFQYSLFTVTGVKKIEWFLSHSRRHFTLDTSIICDPDIFRNLLDIPFTYLIYLDNLKQSLFLQFL